MESTSSQHRLEGGCISGMCRTPAPYDRVELDKHTLLSEAASVAAMGRLPGKGRATQICRGESQGRADLRVHGATIADLGAAAGTLRAWAVSIGRWTIELGLELHSIGREDAGHGHGRSGRAAAAGQLGRSPGRGIVLLLQLLPAHLPALRQRHIPAQSFCSSVAHHTSRT